MRALWLTLRLLIVGLAVFVDSGRVSVRAQTPPTAPTKQTRSFGSRVAVPVSAISVDDGDTVAIHWAAKDDEIVRILGIDTPETRHIEHDIPYDQAFGVEAWGFARGVFAGAHKVEILRANTTDPYGRTLAYLFVDDRNYSVMVIAARLANESVTQFGDNGIPGEAAAVMAAAKAAGPVPFEPPYLYRRRMGDLTKWLKAKGQYPP